MKNKKIYAIAEIGIFVALFIVISQISIPTPFLVPITLQVFIVSLAAFILGVKKSMLALSAYVTLGFIGVPAFAGLGGGASALFGYTGGFIWGFFPLALLCALGKGKIKILFCTLGLAFCHIIGVLWYSILAKINIFAAFVTMSLPYIFKDAVLLILAYFCAKLINKRIKKS